jgi:hypothetical protein
MIEEIRLPEYSMDSTGIRFPFTDRPAHPSITWEGSQGVDVIRHQQE